MIFKDLSYFNYMRNLDNYDYIVVGCGLSGVVIAERLSTILNKKVLIIEKRNHIAGNCFDYKEGDILVNKYGAHLFHTNKENVWEYINKFSEWINWEHKVVAHVDNKLVPVPVNITTVNYLCNQHISNEQEMNDWLLNNQIKQGIITNSEEMALSRVGEFLYDKLFKPYTIKQWNKSPKELHPDVLARIPIRNNHDDRYFTDKYQALPKNGYTKFFIKILESMSINVDVVLNQDFLELNIPSNKKIFYTGPIDAYFKNQNNLGALEYRSLEFTTEVLNQKYYQTNSVVNYPSQDFDFTRIIEYKHFLNQQSDKTVIVKEKSCDHGEPYYPVLNERNLNLYKQYQLLSLEYPNVVFVGRLANFKYFNMDEAIDNALKVFEKECL